MARGAAKLAVLVLAGGALACTLLVLRQARLQAANELAEARLRVRDAEERLRAIRADISRLTTPEAVAELTGEHPEFQPVDAAGAPDTPGAPDSADAPGAGAQSPADAPRSGA